MKYKEEYVTQIVELMSQGLFDYQIAALWDIDRDTIADWRIKYPEFDSAYKRGLAKIQSLYTKKLQENALAGTDKGFKSLSFILANKCDFVKPEESKNVTNQTNITIQGNMQVLQTKSPQELIENIKQDLDFLQSKQIIDVQVEEIPDVNKSDKQE